MPYWEAYHGFRQEHWWDFRRGDRQDPTLGELIEFARRWAHDEIASIKGRPALAEEDAAQKELARRRIEGLTLAGAAKAVLRGMDGRGLSQVYRDRLDKLFSRYVPTEVATKNVCDVSMDDIASLLSSLAPGNLRLLRPFLGQTLDIPGRFGIRPAASSYEFRSLSDHLTQAPDVPRQLRNWARDDYVSFVSELEQERDRWQQAYCLRLFFDFHAPLAQVLAARWDQLWEVNHHGGKGNKHYQWRYKEAPWKFESIRAPQVELVRKCLAWGKEEFGDTPYWFPSRHGRHFEHIRAVDHVWHAALYKRRLRYLSPREFRKALRATHPWFGYDFSRIGEVLSF